MYIVTSIDDLTTEDSCSILRITMDEEILTTKEAAQFLRVSPIQVYRLTRQRELPVIKRGRRYVRYRKSDLIAFLNRYTVKREE